MNPNLQTPVQPQTPQPNTPFIPETKEGNSPKLIMFLFVGLIVIALIVGGGYWYLNNKQASTKVEVNRAPVPVVQQQVQEESIDDQFNSVNIATDDADFATVDQDLQGL